MTIKKEELSFANPAPLGLLGFGMTTVLLNLHNAGIIELSVVIVAMGCTIGGLSQVLVGLMEFKTGNTFGTTAFTSYGFFWLTLVLIWWNPFADKIAAADAKTMGYFLLLWGIYTVFMFIGTLKHNRCLQFVFGSLVILFFLLAIADFTGNKTLTVVAGYEGIVCGLSAIYCSVAQVINGEYKRTILPL